VGDIDKAFPRRGRC